MEDPRIPGHVRHGRLWTGGSAGWTPVSTELVEEGGAWSSHRTLTLSSRQDLEHHEPLGLAIILTA